MASVAGHVGKDAVKKVKPLLSLDKVECKRRVLNLYRAWYRQITLINSRYEIPVTVPQMKQKLHSEFMKNRHIQDIRVIDMLVVKGTMELKEVAENLQQSCHLLNRFKLTCPPKSENFISKFLDGRE